MRVAAMGLLVGAGLVIAALGMSLQRTQAFAQRPQDMGRPFTSSDHLIALSSDAGDQVQQVTLVDPKARVMAVYHIQRSSGEITLKSVRNVHWDLLMDEFNGVSPSPREIRSLLEHR